MYIRSEYVYEEVNSCNALIMSIVGVAKVETLKGALAQAKKEAEANKAATNKAAA